MDGKKTCNFSFLKYTHTTCISWVSSIRNGWFSNFLEDYKLNTAGASVAAGLPPYEHKRPLYECGEALCVAVDDITCVCMTDTCTGARYISCTRSFKSALSFLKCSNSLLSVETILHSRVRHLQLTYAVIKGILLLEDVVNSISRCNAVFCLVSVNVCSLTLSLVSNCHTYEDIWTYHMHSSHSTQTQNFAGIFNETAFKLTTRVNLVYLKPIYPEIDESFLTMAWPVADPMHWLTSSTLAKQ
jgi:hypothetical protein